MFVLAHLSDPHLGPLPRPRVFELANKRILGFYNWHRRRKTIHGAPILAEIVADLKSQTLDHVAVTGDLVNIALPTEFASARAFLEIIGPPHDVTLVPGNHDSYVRAGMEHSDRHWGDYMRGDGAASGFPFVRQRGPIAIIGLSSAVPTAPFMATGALGIGQLQRLGGILDEREGMFRVVLIHHPPESPRSRRHKRLLDAEAFRATLRRHGAELVLHGHDHLHSVVWLDGKTGPIPAVGVPSASATAASSDHGAAYNLYRIDPAAGRCELISRGYQRDGGGIVEIRRQALELAGA